MQFLFLALAYLVLTFLASVALYRLQPRCKIARVIDRHVWLFPILPLLVLFQLVEAVLRFAVGMVLWQARLFDILTGRPIRRSKRNASIYAFRYGGTSRESRKGK